jgi:hypothetical protein
MHDAISRFAMHDWGQRRDVPAAAATTKDDTSINQRGKQVLTKKEENH